MAGTSGSIGAAGTDVEWEILCDDNGGVVTRFMRRLQDNAGTVSVVDTTLDGVTTYAPTGVVSACPVEVTDTEALVLCDDNAGVITTFLRLYEIEGDGTVTATDTQLDGVTAYAPTGTVGICSAAATANPQLDSTIARQTGAGTVTIPAGARSVTVTVVSGAPTVAIGGGAAVTLPAGGSFSWGVDRGGEPGESLQDAFVFTGVAGADYLVHTTREI